MRSKSLLERLLLREAAGQGGEHAIGVGGTARGEPRAYRAQAEFDAVVAGGFGCEAFVDGRGARVIAGADERFGAIDVGWAAAARRGRAAGEQQRHRDDARQTTDE